MYLYVKTPPINHSNKIAHLVEHCVHNARASSIDKYFKICDYNPSTFFSYTKYFIHDQDYESFIKEIEEPLQEKIIKREYKALKEELKQKTFINKFRNFVDKRIWNIKNKEKLNIWDVISYHKNNYNNEHYIIADDNYKIIKNWINIKNENEWKFEILGQSQNVIDWEKNFVTILKYSNRKDQVLLDFIWVLYDTWAEYNYRYIHWSYNYPYSCIVEGDWYVWIALPLLNKYPNTDFIKQAVEYYCILLMEWNARENSIINLLYINQLPSQDDMISFIKERPIDIIQNILWKNN